MGKLESKFVLLLADTSFKERDIDNFIKKLKNGSLEKYRDKAFVIRDILKSDSSTRGAKSIGDLNLDNTDLNSISQYFLDSASDYHYKILTTIKKMLITEAEMKENDVLKSLSNELGIEPPSNRKNFYHQLLYFCENSEGSIIINAAHKIRNQFVHESNKTDWPLKIKQ